MRLAVSGLGLGRVSTGGTNWSSSRVASQLLVPKQLGLEVLVDLRCLTRWRLDRACLALLDRVDVEAKALDGPAQKGLSPRLAPLGGDGDGASRPSAERCGILAIGPLAKDLDEVLEIFVR